MAHPSFPEVHGSPAETADDVALNLLDRAAAQGTDRRLAAPSPRRALGLLVPTADILALAAGVVIVSTLYTVHSLALTIGFAVTAFAVLLLSGSYQPKIRPRLGEELGPLLGRLSFAVVLVALILRTKSIEPDLPLGYFDLGNFVYHAPIMIMLVVLGRALAYLIIREARANGYLNELTVIVGARNLGVKVAETLLAHPEYGLVPLGFLDTIAGTGVPIPMLGGTELPLLGGLSDLEAVVRANGVRRVIVAFGGMREAEMVRTLRASDRLPVEVHVVPRFFELGVAPEGPYTDDLWGITIQRLRRSALRTVAWRVKRAFDLALGSILLILCAPLLAGAAIAVRLSSPGPIFFRQRRIGQVGQVFELLKFRTMSENRDSDTSWSVTDDQRITPVGRVLRATSLDELAQLINVIRGEMSIVGPRPERPKFADEFRVAVQGYDDRHRVPAGMTGWAQVHGLRGDTSIPDRAVFDNYYVEHWSLWRDILIVGRTFGQILKRAGA